MKHKYNFYVLIALLAMILATLACTIFVGGPEYPAQPIPVSTEAVLSLEEQIKAAILAGQESGSVTLLINEAQLTSYLAFKLQTDQESLLTDPQVTLREGKMQVYGKTQQGIFAANMGITLTIGVDEQGKSKLEISSIDFGPFPVPEGLNEAMTAAIQETFTGSLGPVATGFRLETITIADGVMTVTGRIK